MATLYLAGRYAVNDGRGDGSDECTQAIGAIEALDFEGNVETIVSNADTPAENFSDRNIDRVMEAYCQTLDDSDAESLCAFERHSPLISQNSEDGRTVHLGPLTFERGCKVLVKAGSNYSRIALCEKLSAVDGLGDVIFQPLHPSRDEFGLGILQTVIMHAMQCKKVDGEIFVFALSGAAHFAFWASSLREAFAVWNRAANDAGQLTAPSRSRLFVKFRKPDRPFGADIAADICTVRCQPWGPDEEEGTGI